MEAEMMRKKEHLNTATNFKKSRGWVRSNHKTRGYKPDCETLDDFLEFSSSDDEAVKIEQDSQASPVVPKESMTRRSMNKPAKGPLFADLTQDESYGHRPTTAVHCR